jgi:serine/threonine protein kinase
MSTPARVFVSYHATDAAAYDQLRKFLGGPQLRSRLTLLGCREPSWASLSPADRVHQLKASDYTLVLLSADYCADAGCLAELSQVQSFGHVVTLPVRLRPFPNELLPLPLSQRQGLPRGPHALSEFADADSGWSEVARDILHLLDSRHARTAYNASRASLIQSGQLVAARYLIEDRIGSGGMATVYRAVDQQQQLRVAIKILHPWFGYGTPERVRFEREAALLKSLEHPHIVRIRDFATDDSLGVAYITLELLDGQTLADYIKITGRLSLSELIFIHTQVVSALDAVHKNDIIHRDLKPDNVILTGAGKLTDRHCKLIDFGIAKFPSAEDPANTVPLVSQHYMAPEQSSPDTPITVATDVWALGLMAFFLLTGRHYFKAADQRQPEPAAILREIWDSKRKDARERAAEVGCRDCIPEGFHSWLMRCIASAAGDRYRSATDALAELRRLPRPDDGPAPAAPVPNGSPTPAGPTGPQTALLPSQPGRLFPLYSVYLGQTHTDKLKQLGDRSKLWDLWPLWKYQYYTINGMNFWYDNRGIATHIYITRGEKIPDQWINLGLNWNLSFFEAQQVLIGLRFEIIASELTSPSSDGWTRGTIRARRGFEIVLNVNLSFLKQGIFNEQMSGALYSINFSVDPDR